MKGGIKIEYYDYGEGIIVSKKCISNLADAFISAIKIELPEEAQCPAVINSVLADVKDVISHKQLRL